jgi:hypothetical protein
MKRMLPIVAVLLSACSAQQGPNYELNGAQGTKELAEQAVAAYQHGDKERWNKLLCHQNDDVPLSGWTSMKAIVGDISEVKLVKIAEGTKAGNAHSLSDAFSTVVFEVQSQKYPLKTLLLKFFETEKKECVGLIY